MRDGKDIADFADLTSPPVLFVNNSFSLSQLNTKKQIKIRRRKTTNTNKETYLEQLKKYTIQKTKTMNVYL